MNGASGSDRANRASDPSPRAMADGAEVPPLAVDIDGTLTRADDSIDPRIFDALRGWNAPVVIATGKAFPYPIALCHFMRIEELVIAENGGVVAGRGTVDLLADPAGPRAVVEAFEAAGFDLRWEEPDLVNRWRETEVAVRRTAPFERLEAIADEFDMSIVDSGYAYHVKSPSVDKGRGLRRMAELLDRSPEEFVAIGDSQNDIELFEAAGRSFAVANAHDRLKTMADRILTENHADGLLEALSELREEMGADGPRS